jgi:hypothetical protein
MTGRGGRLWRLLGSISLIGLICAAPVGAPWHPLRGNLAVAAMAEDGLFSDLTPMTRAELSRQRGGFSISGFNISVGISVETVVDGFVKVSTSFSMGDGGQLTHLGTDVKTYTPSGAFVPDVAAIVQRATPDVGAIMDHVFDAADAAKGDGTVDKKAAAGGATAAAVLGTADTLVKVTEGLVPGADTAKAPAGGEVPASPVQSAARSTAPTVPVTSGPFDGEVLAGDPLAGSVAASPKTTAAKTIKTSPKATASATVAAPAAVAASSRPPGAATQVSIGQAEAPKVGTSDNGIQVADLAGADTPRGGQASILHQVGDGHLSIIENSMNNVTVRQSTRINLTVENFMKTQDMIRLQKSLETTARLAGIASLRR